MVGVMHRFRFIHDSLREYFAAEAIAELCTDGISLASPQHLREATLHELDCLAREYGHWGASLYLLPDLISDQTVLCELLKWCQPWQQNLFALDCLPLLYLRVERFQEMWDLVGRPVYCREKLKKHWLCHRSIQNDVRTALDIAVKRHNLAEMVRFAFLLTSATAEARFPFERKFCDMATDARYEAATRQVDLLAGRELESVRYRLFLIIAWIAALNSDRDDPERAEHHLDNARRALERALQTEGIIACAWSAVVLKLAETLLAKEINGAVEVVTRFGSDSNERQSALECSCRCIAQLAKSSNLRREIREHMVRMVRTAEGLAQDPHNLSGDDRPSKLSSLIASAYGALNYDEDAKRICASLVTEFEERLQSGETGVRLAWLAEAITDMPGDIQDRNWIAGMCSRLLTNDDFPSPFRGYVLACVGELLWYLEDRERGRQAVRQAITAAEDIRHPWTQASVLTRVVQAARKVECEGEGGHLLRLLNMSKDCVERLLGLLCSFLESKERWSWSGRLEKPDKMVSHWDSLFDTIFSGLGFWRYVERDSPPEESEWTDKGSYVGPRVEKVINDLVALECSVLESLRGLGQEAASEGRSTISRFIALLKSAADEEACRDDRLKLFSRDIVWGLWETALELDRIGEFDLSSHAIDAFAVCFQEIRRSRSEFDRLVLWLKTDIDNLGIAILSNEGFRSKHLEKLANVVSVIEDERPGFREALEAGYLSYFLPGPRNADLYGVVTPQRELVRVADRALGRGNLVEAAKCFEADVLSVRKYETARQYKGFHGLSFLALVRRLAQRHMIEQAMECSRKVLQFLIPRRRKLSDEAARQLVDILATFSDKDLYEISSAIRHDGGFLWDIMWTLSLSSRQEWERVQILVSQIKISADASPAIPELLALADTCSDRSLIDSAGKIYIATFAIAKAALISREYECASYEREDDWSRHLRDCCLAAVAARRFLQRNMRDEGERIFQLCVDKAEWLRNDEEAGVALSTIARELQKAGKSEWASVVAINLAERITRHLRITMGIPRPQVEYLCGIAGALADFEDGKRARALIADATEIAKGLDDSGMREKLVVRVVKAMLKVGQQVEALSLAKQELTGLAAREEVSLFCADAAARRVSIPVAYALLEEIPPDRRGGKWVRCMAGLLAKLGRDQGWPSQWSRKLAALLNSPHIERLATADFVLAQLISLCQADEDLLKTAAMCETIPFPNTPA